jgi:hypothetical protein
MKKQAIVTAGFMCAPGRKMYKSAKLLQMLDEREREEKVEIPNSFHTFLSQADV